MEIAIVLVLVVGIAVGYFIGLLMASKAASEEKTQWVAKAEVLASEVEQQKQLAEHERQYAARLREESDRQWEQKLEALRQEMQKMAAEQLAAKQSALQESNRQQMDELLRPVKEQFADFKKSVEESKTLNEVNKKELQHTFEATMRLFQQEQQQAQQQAQVLRAQGAALQHAAPLLRKRCIGIIRTGLVHHARYKTKGKGRVYAVPPAMAKAAQPPQCAPRRFYQCAYHVCKVSNFSTIVPCCVTLTFLPIVCTLHFVQKRMNMSALNSLSS